MKIISTIQLARLNHGAHHNYHSRVLEIIEADNKVKQKVKTKLAQYKAAIKAEEEMMNQNRKSQHSVNIKQDDVKRIRLLNALKMLVKGHEHHPQTQISAAYYRLNNYIYGYRGLKNSKIDERTGLIETMVNELGSTYIEDVRALNITWLLENLKQTNDKFIRHLNLRNTENTDRKSGKSRLLKKQTNKLYKELINEIEARILFEGKTDYEKVTGEINTHILRNKLYVIKQKVTLPEAGNEDLPPLTTTPEPPSSGSGGGGTAPDPSA